MKLIKTANGKKKVKMSRKEWQSIGKKAGWDDTGEGEHDVSDVPRTILLYGRSGVGKSYFAKQLAEMYKLQLNNVRLEERYARDTIINTIASSSGTVFLLDEVDRFSEILPIISNISNLEANNNFIVMTTNYIEDIDTALIEKIPMVTEMTGPNFRLFEGNAQQKEKNKWLGEGDSKSQHESPIS